MQKLNKINKTIFKYDKFEGKSFPSERVINFSNDSIEIFTTEEIKVLSFLTGKNKEGKNYLAT